MKTKTKTISFKTTKADAKLVTRIIERAADYAHGQRTTIPPQLSMDLIACHANGCPLDLAALLAFPDFDFVHDVWGIHRYIDRETGELTDCFLPRCSKPEVA